MILSVYLEIDMTTQEFAQKVKTKYPQYQSLDDTMLVQKMLAKYPQYKSSISDTSQSHDAPPTNTDAGQSKDKGFWASSWDAVKSRAGNVWNDFKEYQSGNQTFGETALQTVGQEAGLATDVIGAGVKGVYHLIPENIRGAIRQDVGAGAQKVLQTPAGQAGLQALQSGMSAYKSWKQKNPRVARDVEAVVNIASIVPVEGGANVAVSEVAPELKALAETGVEAVAKSAESQSLKGALEVVQPVLSKAEKEAALQAGRGETKGLLRTVVIEPSTRDKEVARAVMDVVKKGAAPTKNIELVDKAISKVGATLDKVLSKDNTPFTNPDLEAVLDGLKEGSKVTFAGDATLEKNYDAVRQAFTDIFNKVDKNGDRVFPHSVQGLWKARIEFDNLMKSKLPNVFTKLVGDDARRNAIMDVRRGVNDFIAETLPDGNPYKDSLKKMSLMYEAQKNIAKSSVSSVGTNVITRSAIYKQLAKHPALELGAAAGVGVGGYLAGGLVAIAENPLVLGALAVGGTYKLGKMVLTAPALKQAAEAFLQVAANSLSDTERASITELVTKLSEGAAVLGAKEKTKAQ